MADNIETAFTNLIGTAVRGRLDAPAIVTGWTLVAEVAKHDGAQVVYVHTPVDQPLHRTLGLLDFASTLARADITEDS